MNVSSAFFGRSCIGPRWCFQDFHEALGEAGVFENLAQQNQAQARIVVARDGEQRVVEFAIAAETLRAGHEPEIEFVFERAEIGDELVLVALGIVDQVARVHFEEFREQHARGVREVRAARRIRSAKDSSGRWICRALSG